MNREIKFRGKRIDNKQWFYGSLYYGFSEASGYKGIGAYLTAYEPENNSFTTYEIDPKTVGQYTGLKDKNGVDGFADDIVKAGKDELFKIGWFEDTASWILSGLETGKVRWIECRENFCLNDFQINFKECEVIGNIYENPELLK